MGEVDKYEYDLPRHLIAQHPVASRADARLLVVDRPANSLSHRYVRDLPEILRPGDCLVLNDTRVVPARLVGRRDRTGGRWEGLFLETAPEGLWRMLCKARSQLTPGETVTLFGPQGEEDIRVQLGAKQSDGSWIVRPQSNEATFALLDRIGRVPLPPYIRKGQMVQSDRERYQTVYARSPGAVAAPTAGLHFTEGLLARLGEQGVTLAWVTLHVGAGTFRPIATQSLAEHPMHTEWGRVDQQTVEKIESCRRSGGRVVAVGTTSVRLLETAAAEGAGSERGTGTSPQRASLGEVRTGSEPVPPSEQTPSRQERQTRV